MAYFFSSPTSAFLEAFHCIFILPKTGEVETVIVGEKTFFLLQNDSVWSGVWEDNNYAISILSSKGKQELIQIIQSIGGQHE